MIAPPAAGNVPPEAQSLYGDRFAFIAAGVNISALDHEHDNAAATHIPAAARSRTVIRICTRSPAYFKRRGVVDTSHDENSAVRPERLGNLRRNRNGAIIQTLNFSLLLLAQRVSYILRAIRLNPESDRAG